MIAEAILPIGQLSEEAAEACYNHTNPTTSIYIRDTLNLSKKVICTHCFMVWHKL